MDESVQQIWQLGNRLKFYGPKDKYERMQVSEDMGEENQIDALKSESYRVERKHALGIMEIRDLMGTLRVLCKLNRLPIF